VDAFAAWMFRDGESSHFSARNTHLSDQAKEGFAAAYLQDEATAARETARRRGILEALAGSGSLGDEAKRHHASRLEALTR
jgi:hypothetical protein